MTNQTLQELVEKISRTFFGREFTHTAFFNTRLQTTGGRYHLTSHAIDINPRVYQLYGEEELIKVIKHELCHYHLHLQGLGHQHKDQTFKRLLKQTGGSRYCLPLKAITWQVYECQNCQAHLRRRKKVDTKRYVCGNCHGKLRYVGCQESELPQVTGRMG